MNYNPYLSIFALCAIFLIIFKKVYFYRAKDPVIIILNGPSVAGKSSIQKELQMQAQDFFVRLGVDNLFDNPLPSALDCMVKVDPLSISRTEYFPEGISDEEFARITEVYESRVKQSNELIRAGIKTFDADGNPLLILKVGPAGNRTIHGMHRAIKGYADAGCNVVVDYILYDKDWALDLQNVLKGYNVYFVKVAIPLTVLEEREKARGTSPVGHARSHYNEVYQAFSYDLEVDSSKKSSKEIAGEILEFIRR